MVVVIMGVSGTGKTTLGRALARATGADFVDADDFHPQENVEKMRHGVPLTEADRAPWLSALRRLVDERLASGELTVLACSALTRASRRRLGVGRDGVELVFLSGPPELIRARMRRRAHFMPPDLLGSQLATLEPPADALELDVSRPVDALVAQVRGAFGL